jgi:hypothetical protein
VREGIIDFMQREHPKNLPRLRIFSKPTSSSAENHGGQTEGLPESHLASSLKSPEFAGNIRWRASTGDWARRG